MTFDPLQQVGAQLHVGGVDAHRGEVVFAGFHAELGDLFGGGIRLEQGVVDHACHAEIGGDDTHGGGDALRTGADDLAKFIEAGGGAHAAGAIALAHQALGDGFLDILLSVSS